MFEFAWWWALLLFPLPLLVRALPAQTQSPKAALRVPQGLSAVTGSPPGIVNRRPVHILLWVIWLLCVLAAARPQWLGEPVSIPNEGRELMLAVDLSGSMKVGDMEINGQQVNRLTMTKAVLSDFIERRVSDRLGLILFADTAYLQAPLTFDRNTVAQLLNEAVIGLVGERTAIGDAIGLAVKRLDAREESNKVLVLLTDGQNTAGNITPAQAKELAVANEITIYTIGVGAESMVVDNFFGSRQVNPSQELDEEMLAGIASATGGQYFRARNRGELEKIYERLDELEPIKGDSQKMRPLSALYFYPLAAALLLSMVIIFVSVAWQAKQYIASKKRSIK
ncbi:vWA domain-containing protein [Salinimonas chungwhensis]|uniref:vWA domain-containing protein n=1 Tax=Salinimonas chungwhensis TaxID=265425 RepID=UPI00035F2FF9|nr:VWA domain-containing protein [Salinimonas chungwhensis]